MEQDRVLASIEDAGGSEVIVRVYKQEGDEVERTAWCAGEFGAGDVAELLRGGAPQLVPRDGSTRA